MLVPILAVGILLGMKHALEADHLAAVAALSVSSSSVRRTAKVAAAWGAGHALALIALGAVLIALDATLPESVSRALEGAAGGMLVLLGLDGLRRSWRGRGLAAATANRLQERHDAVRMKRALLVGSIHGISGTGALVLLSLQALRSGTEAFLYLVTLGVGAVLGMVACSALLTVPLELSARRLAGSTRGLELALAVANIGIGCWVAVRAAG